jgi:hypothetical protein
MKGTMKPAAPMRIAREARLPHVGLGQPAAANTASATGGVIADRIAK